MEKAKNKAAIRKIAIGGTSALVLGTATSFAAYNVVTNDTPQAPANDNGTHPANEPAEPNFNEAFAAARENFGAGGAFEWKGNIYSTFTEEEWDSMSEIEREQYALNVESLFNNPDDLDADLFADDDMDIMAEVALDVQMDGDTVGEEIDGAILEAEGEILAEAALDSAIDNLDDDIIADDDMNLMAEVALDNAIDDAVLEAEVEAAVEAELDAAIEGALEDDGITIEPIADAQNLAMEIAPEVPMMETSEDAAGEMPDYINNAGDEIGLI